jgi:hypothetical protein
MKSLLPAILAVFALLFTAAGAELPNPKTGGLDGSPVAILALTETGELDAAYKDELAQRGYRLAAISWHNRVNADYFRQFNVVILSRLPYAGQRYQVGGEKLAHLAYDLDLVHQYVETGGGLIFQSAMSEFGEAYAATYNEFLKRYDARFIPQQLRHDAETVDAYAAGIAAGKHELTDGLKGFLYPINVLRWDHAYSTTPMLVGKDWTVLVTGKPGSGTHQALDNSRVGEQLTPNRNIFALRKHQKGWVAVSAIHSYYTLTHAYSKAKNLGENNTGVIDGIVLHGEKEGRASDFGELLDRCYCYLAASSTAAGFGGKEVPLPPQPPAPEVKAVIDWRAAVPPPTWRHRVIPVWVEKGAYYDEHPDPALVGDLKFFKALVGARTALSDGAGSVSEYRKAAMEAGYSVIAFCERFEDMDRQEWDSLLADCAANSDDQLVCLPGINIEDFQGNRYLIFGQQRFPDPSWLAPGSKRLKAVRMLSLGFFGHVASVHHPGMNPLQPEMYKHFQAVTVYTYDGKGNLIDDGLHTYQWQIRSDSNPIPVVAHEVASPAEVPAAVKGFQQILPGTNLKDAVDYFRFGFPHYFECPLRYFISEGPILTGWSIVNKDIGNPDENRDHWRLGIALKSDVPIDEVTLYDGFSVAGRWHPGTPDFQAVVDGFHEMQHEFMLLARDKSGRRVLSPGIRTVTRNWRLRCGDRQNWLGSIFIYTGWHLNGISGYSVPIRNAREGGTHWLGNYGGNPCPVFDYPFFSNHVRIEDANYATKYVEAGWEDIGGDAKAPRVTRPNDFTEGSVRVTYFLPKRPNFAVAVLEKTIALKREIEPEITAPIYPTVTDVTGPNNLLILPGKPVDKFASLIDPKTNQRSAGNPQNLLVELPVGTYAGGVIPLSKGLVLRDRTIGFPAPPKDTLTLPATTRWQAAYLQLKASPFHWRRMYEGYVVDEFAERALAEMGFRGETPYRFNLAKGRLAGVAYVADLAAQDYGVAGALTGHEALSNLPMRIDGLNPRWAAAVWRSDSKHLDYFACFEGKGYVTFDVDKDVRFYIGNVVTAGHQALFTSVVLWTGQEAWFRVNNPTRQDITTWIATPKEIEGFLPVRTEMTFKAGISTEVKLAN